MMELPQPPTELELIATSQFFDREWYLKNYPDVAEAGIDPAAHYLLSGAAEERDPGPRFCTHAYLQRYPDVAESGMNPLLHYLRHGADEERDISPMEQPKSSSDVELIAASEFFDRDWYLKRYPDVAAAELNPAAHYLASGAAEGRDPGPRFSTRTYLRRNRDVAAAGVNPLLHYLRLGM